MRAYTYLIGWTDYDKWYYGVRFKPGCRADELGTTYLSSSKYVKKFIVENGPPDIIEVRREFDSVDAARTWETKVLRRMRVVKSDRWLNRTDNKAIVHNGSHNKGKPRRSTPSPLKGISCRRDPDAARRSREKLRGQGWWSNGEIEIRSRDDPGNGFRRGRRPRLSARPPARDASGRFSVI